MIGTRFGPYTLEAELGRGGMGEVHRARDEEHDGRVVALKLLPPGLSADPQYRARFRREAEHVARLSEPHIPAIHRYGEIAGRLFLDMALAPGRDLGSVLEAGPLPPATAVLVVEQVAAALDAAHAAGLVHRDVKPTNVLLDERTGRPPFVTLIDFGIATAAEPGSRTALTRTGAVIGTVAYMAPERFLAEPVGPPADVYALTCVLHELLTGRRPFPQGPLEQVMAAHLHRPPPAPGAVRPGLPSGFDDVVARGMAKSPAERFPTAGALAAAARTALSTEPSPADGPADAPEQPRPAMTLVAPPTALAEPPAAAVPPRRPARGWLLPAGVGLGIGALALVLALVLGLVPRLGGPSGPGAPPLAKAGPAPVQPSGGPIGERAFVGLGDAAPEVYRLGTASVLVPQFGSPVTVLDAATGAPVGAPLDVAVSAVAVARHGDRTLAVTADLDGSVMRVWDLATGEALPTTMSGHTAEIESIVVAPVGGRDVVASISLDKTVRRWDLETGAPIGEPLSTATEGVIGISDQLDVVGVDNRTVLVPIGGGRPMAWDLATGARLDAPPRPGPPPTTFAVGIVGGRPVELADADSLDQDYLHTPRGQERLRLLDVVTGAPVAESTRTLPTATQFSTIRAVTEVAGRPLAVAMEDTVIRLYDLRTGATVGDPLTGHEGKVIDVRAFEANGRQYLLSRSADRSMRLWDLTARAGGVTGVAAPQLGPYLLQGLIGVGAMGEVHRALDSAHGGRPVALKLLPPHVAQDPERRARFQRESSVVAALTEPHVIDVHRYGEIDGRLFLDMQLVDGPDLAALLIAAGPLPPEHAVAVIEQVAAALDAAHAAGLVHGDVKPSNVLVHRPVPGRTPRVVLADFGIAGAGDGSGTAEYLAPERWRGESGDGRVDVYALACVLYELLTGTRAFPGGEFAAQLHGHLHLPPPRPSTALPAAAGVDVAALDTVVAAGMAKDPRQRPAAAGQLAAMARASLPSPRSGPTRRQVLVGAAAGVVTLGGGLAVATALRTRSSTPPVRIVPDRALGIRSSALDPFRLATIDGTAFAVVIDDGSAQHVGIQSWDLLADSAVGPARTGGVDGIAYLNSQLTIGEVDGRAVLCAANAPLLAKPPFRAVFFDLRTGESAGQAAVPNPGFLAFTAAGGPALLVVDQDEGALSRVDLMTGATTATTPPVAGAGVLPRLVVTDVGGTTCGLVSVLGGPPTAFDAVSLEKVAAWRWSAGAVVTVDGEPIGVGVSGQLVIGPPDADPRVIDVPGAVRVTTTLVDDRAIAAVGLASGDIVLYDVATGGRLAAVLSGHRAKVTQLDVVLSGDRPILVSAAADNTIRVWDLAVHAYG